MRLNGYMAQVISNTGNEADSAMKENRFLKQAWTHNSSIRTDLPLTVIQKKRKRLIETIRAGQLFCVGEVYLKTHQGTIRIR